MFHPQFENAINKIETVCKNLDGEISHFSNLLSSRLELEEEFVHQNFIDCIKFLTFSDEELSNYFKEQRELTKENEKKKLEKLAQKEARQLQRLEKKAKEKKTSPSASTIASKKFDWSQKPIQIGKDNEFWSGYNLKIEGQYYQCSSKTKFIYQKEGSSYYLFGLQELENECILEESLSDEIKIWAFASNFVVNSISDELMNRAYEFIEKHRTDLLDEFDDVQIN